VSVRRSMPSIGVVRIESSKRTHEPLWSKGREQRLLN
jgi:hypothetical protein